MGARINGVYGKVNPASDIAMPNGTANGSVNGTDAAAAANGSAPPKRDSWILTAFVEMCSGHQSPGLWRHPKDESSNFNDIEHWVKVARLCERGKFHAMFIADVLGPYDVYGGPRNLKPAVRTGSQIPVNEPIAVVSAMAAVTKSIGFGVTMSTTYEQPYHLARRLSTVDHLTKGRVAWNVVTSYLESAARNLGRETQLPHDERYRIAEEYMDVTYKLWEGSWRRDAVTLDIPRNHWAEPSRVREINHEGKYFKVPGPHFCQPSPQRTPVIMQAGTSKSGMAFASRHAEGIFVSGHSAASVAASVRQIRAQAAELGRNPRDIKFIAKMCCVLGRTHAEAEAKYQDYLSYGDREGALALFGGWTGVDMSPYGDDEELRYVKSNAIRSYIDGLVKHAPKKGRWTKTTLAEHIMIGGLGGLVVGDPVEAADELERWVAEADVDGFNFAYAVLPQDFEDVVDLLMPELQRRGLFWRDYAVPGGTFRENLAGRAGAPEPAPSHPASKYAWNPPAPGEADPTVDDGAARVNGVAQANGTHVNGTAAAKPAPPPPSSSKLINPVYGKVNGGSSAADQPAPPVYPGIGGRIIPTVDDGEVFDPVAYQFG